MSYILEPNSKPKRFTNLAELDQFIHHRYRDDAGLEHAALEVGAIRRMAMYFDRLTAQIKRVSSSVDQPWIQHERGMSMTVEGRFLWQVLRDANTEAPIEVCVDRRLSPWLVIGLHLARKWAPILQGYTVDGPNSLDMNADRPRKILTHIAYVIRRVCRSAKFRNWINNDTRNAKENYLSCANLMIDYFRYSARLLVLRVDLYFEGDAKIFSESKAAEKAYTKFLRNLREGNIVPDFIGYVGKRECGLERRIHYHVLVVMNGDLHQQAYQWGEKLGQFWVHECVGDGSLASYINCWVRRDEYKYNCIGVIHYSDSRMIMGLRNALEYLCKEGEHTLVGEHMGRNLRKSTRPKRPQGLARRGAPRKLDHDLSAAKQVLLTLDTQEKAMRAAPRSTYSLGR